jgi:hypothetical protein
MIAFVLLMGGVLAPVAQASADEAALPDEPGVTKQQQQQVQVASNAPVSLGSAAATEPIDQGRQTKRILYVIPNFRSVSADEQLPPQTVKEKFKTASEDSFDYSSFIFVAGQAGVAQANNSYPEFRQGAKGYGRYYWHTLADEVNENTFVEFIVPATLHQDTRFYTLGRGNVGRRLGYAFTRIFVTRNDDGHAAFNYSEVLGAGIFAGVANLYYPSQERTEVKSYQRWVTNLCIDGVTFAFKEIWPDINSSTFHQQE